MSGFSEDGQWWWDGSQWVPTVQVVIPDLAIRQSKATVRAMRNTQVLGDLNTIMIWNSLLAFPFAFAEHRAFREFRAWTLEQLVAAAAYLVGPAESMLAAETDLYRPILSLFSYVANRDFAVVVTTGHVLVLRFDGFAGQPRWVSLAARPNDVRLEAHGASIGANPTIVVRQGERWWSITGTARIAQLDPVIAAWRAGLTTTAAT